MVVVGSQCGQRRTHNRRSHFTAEPNHYVTLQYHNGAYVVNVPRETRAYVASLAVLTASLCPRPTRAHPSPLRAAGASVPALSPTRSHEGWTASCQASRFAPSRHATARSTENWRPSSRQPRVPPQSPRLDGCTYPVASSHVSMNHQDWSPHFSRNVGLKKGWVRTKTEQVQIRMVDAPCRTLQDSNSHCWADRYQRHTRNDHVSGVMRTRFRLQKPSLSLFSNFSYTYGA